MEKERIASQIQTLSETPPGVLYYGTARKNMPLIVRQGITFPEEGVRVRLFADPEMAKLAGGVEGKPVYVVPVLAAEMYRAGVDMTLSKPEIWLTGPIKPEYLYIPKPDKDEFLGYIHHIKRNKS